MHALWVKHKEFPFFPLEIDPGVLFMLDNCSDTLGLSYPAFKSNQLNSIQSDGPGGGSGISEIQVQLTVSAIASREVKSNAHWWAGMRGSQHLLGRHED